MYRKARHILLALCLSGVVMTGASALADSCPTFPPVVNVEGVYVYSDKAGSEVDPTRQEKAKTANSGIIALLKYAEPIVDADKTDPSKVNCLRDNLQNWATSNAMLRPPLSQEGYTQRLELTLGFDVVAAKLAWRKFPASPVTLDWLRRLNIANTEGEPRKGNLLYWSGASTAIAAALTGDDRLRKFQQDVWSRAMGDVTEAGFFPVELHRSHRALIYQQFALSALLVHRSARIALGYPVRADEAATLHRAATAIGQAICTPATIERIAEATQEVPGEWAYRVPLAFGQQFVDHNWLACGDAHASLISIPQGGDLGLARLAIEGLR